MSLQVINNEVILKYLYFDDVFPVLFLKATPTIHAQRVHYMIWVVGRKSKTYFVL